MVKILVLSDLHYGYNSNTAKVLSKFLQKIVQKESPFDLCIISGDIVSHRQRQWQPVWKLLTTHIPVPILFVLGNHDFWDRDRLYRNVDDLIKAQQENIFSKIPNIYYLNPTLPYIYDNLAVFGIDGWYKHNHPPTNDQFHIPDGIWGMGRLRNRYYDQIDQFLDNCDNYKHIKNHIFVTHHEIYSSDGAINIDFCGEYKLFDKLQANSNIKVIIQGHTHKHIREQVEDQLIVNVGSNYNLPSYQIIKIGRD